MSNKNNRDNNSNTPSKPAVTTPPAPQDVTPATEAATAAPTPAEETVEATGMVVSAHSPELARATEAGVTGMVVDAPPAEPEPLSDVLNREKPFDVFAPHAFKDLAKLFPLDAQYLRKLKPVDDESLEALVARLPEGLRENFEGALEKLHPTKIGDHRQRRSSLQTYDVRLYHGTGDDPMRPMLVTEGGIYGSDGAYLAAANAELAKMHNAPEFLDAYVLAGYDVNTLWPPREKEKEAALQFGIGGPEDETKANAPICKSIDREWGDTYGSCATCTLRPFRGQGKGKEAAVDEEATYGCRSEVQLWVVTRDLSSIYRFVFSGTNAKNGRAIMKATQPWNSLHKHFFRMTTEKEVSKTDKKQRWYVVKAIARTAKDEMPSPEVAAVLAAMARQIDTGYYWPERRRIHLSEPKAIGGNTGTDGSDLLALSEGDGGSAPAPKALPPTSGAQRPNNL